LTFSLLNLDEFFNVLSWILKDLFHGNLHVERAYQPAAAVIMSVVSSFNRSDLADRGITEK